MKIGVSVRVRDEDKILCDFVKHYLFLGFDRIIIFDYNSNIKVSELLSNNNLLLENIIVIRKECYFEYDTYHQAINMNKDLDWLFICDADEFLYIESEIKKYLEKFESNVSSILINWVVFGTSNLKTYDKNKTIFEQFI
jgi:phosphopantetheine adenylyltransferase